MDKRFGESDLKVDRGFEKFESRMEKIFADADARREALLAKYQRSTLLWMFTFFVATELALVAWFVALVRIALKQ